MSFGGHPIKCGPSAKEPFLAMPSIKYSLVDLMGLSGLAYLHLVNDGWELRFE